MRARNIKPGFFKNECLAECDPLARILFEGLWCLADREGRFEWRPKKMKAEILPYDDCSVESLLDQLLRQGLIITYSVNGNVYGHIPKFKKHQNPHPRESQSLLPNPEQALPGQCQGNDEAMPRQDQGRTKAMTRQCQDSLNPDILNPDSGSLIPENNNSPNPAAPYRDDFESTWQNYPRKIYKKQAFDKYKATRRKGATAEELDRAVKNYARACEGNENRFILHGKTFFGPGEPWRDWVRAPPETSGNPEDHTPQCKNCGIISRQMGIEETGLCNSCRWEQGGDDFGTNKGNG